MTQEDTRVYLDYTIGCQGGRLLIPVHSTEKPLQPTDRASRDLESHGLNGLPFPLIQLAYHIVKEMGTQLTAAQSSRERPTGTPTAPPGTLPHRWGRGQTWEWQIFRWPSGTLVTCADSW